LEELIVSQESADIVKIGIVDKIEVQFINIVILKKYLNHFFKLRKC